MKVKNIKLIFLIFVVAIVGCDIKPDPIKYGTDMCSFCSMTIVDSQHASQVVTEKGKNFKFDAIECMINFLKSEDENSMEFILVADYANPGVFINAKESFFLIDPEISSPMGANLSAFSSLNSLENVVRPGSDVKKLGWISVKSVVEKSH